MAERHEADHTRADVQRNVPRLAGHLGATEFGIDHGFLGFHGFLFIREISEIRGQKSPRYFFLPRGKCTNASMEIPAFNFVTSTVPCRTPAPVAPINRSVPPLTWNVPITVYTPGLDPR